MGVGWVSGGGGNLGICPNCFFVFFIYAFFIQGR